MTENAGFGACCDGRPGVGVSVLTGWWGAPSLGISKGSLHLTVAGISTGRPVDRRPTGRREDTTTTLDRAEGLTTAPRSAVG
jgi:hypothetical protein